MKRYNDGDRMPYHGCLLVAAFVKMVSCLANSIFCTHTYADNTSIEVDLFILTPNIYVQFRKRFARSQMEVIFLVL